MGEERRSKLRRIMKKAHAKAKKMIGDYTARLSIALRLIWRELEEEKLEIYCMNNEQLYFKLVDGDIHINGATFILSEWLDDYIDKFRLDHEWSYRYLARVVEMDYSDVDCIRFVKNILLDLECTIMTYEEVKELI